MADDAQAAATMLSAPELKLDVATAFKRVQTAPAAKPRLGFSLPVLRPSTRPMFAGFGAAAIVVALAITGFANILPLFQPKTVQPVPVTFADLQSLSSLSAYGTLTWSTKPQPQVVLSAADAKAVSGLDVPVVGKLPATVGPAVVEVFGDMNASSGADSSSQNINLPQLIVAKSAVPVVTSTQVTAKQLEDYILSMPGVSPQLAAAIRSIGDPATTLPIPVPVEYASSSKVSIN